MNPQLVIALVAATVYAAVSLVLPMGLNKVDLPVVNDVNASLVSNKKNLVAGTVVVALCVALALFVSVKAGWVVVSKSGPMSVPMSMSMPMGLRM